MGTNHNMHQQSKQLQERLRDEILGIKIYSSHEHFYMEEQYLKMHLDFVELISHYGLWGFCECPVHAETVTQLRSPDVSEDDKWNLFEPYRDRIWNMGCYRETQLVLRGLYGIKDLTRQTYRAVGECLRKNQRPGHYKEIMDKSGVEYAMVDLWPAYGEYPKYDQKCFSPVYRIDEWYETDFYEKYGISSVENAFDEIGRHMQRLSDYGVKAIKIANPLADNTPFSTKWEKSEIEKAFKCLLGGEFASRQEIDPFAHSIVSEFVRHAAEHSMCVQIHRGWQMFSAGSPYQLKPLFDSFPQVTFDIFHAAYPYDGELAVLARICPNIYPDLCLVAKESETLTKRILAQWLEMIPINQILAFGSDVLLIDSCYGYQQFVRETVLEVLVEKILSKTFSEDEAVIIAHRILRENLKSILK